MSNSSMRLNISGIHSKQPWFVLDSKQFLTHLTTEHPQVSHFYSFKAGDSTAPTTVIPDACIDIVIDCDKSNQGAFIYGTSLEASSVSFERGHRYFGVRLIPGITPDYLHISAGELIGKSYRLQDVMPNSEQLVDRIINCGKFTEQVAAVNHFLKFKSPRKATRLTEQLVAKINQHHGNIQVQDLEKYSGYTRKTLQRKFKEDLGISPKIFSRTIRCQSAVYGIHHTDNMQFTDMASDLGFSDQSHFLREFKKLVSTTPLKYQKQIKNKTYLERISCY